VTFAIAARDATRTEAFWGVAVASRALASGALIPWARAGAGAIAYHALVSRDLGNQGLDLLARGCTAQEVMEKLTRSPDLRQDFQIGIVDSRGTAAHFTGELCLPWAAGIAGDGFSCQGNSLVGPHVLTEMAEAFIDSEANLPQRLITALAAGDRAGGDRRGRRSAAILIVGSGTDISEANRMDLRVDSHLEPLAELQKLLDLHNLFSPPIDDLDFAEIHVDLAEEIRSHLSFRGYNAGVPGTGYDELLRAALLAWVSFENLEKRWEDSDLIDRRVLNALRSRDIKR
jgi:uncharacterized Ntn-hydrolase superfamily protein